jgi:tetratricopeptide (TPR) repeat protein
MAEHPDHELQRPFDFRFWTPPPDATVPVGSEARPVVLPAVPLPVHRQDLAADPPSADAIGNGVYDFLRRFPDCEHNRQYAELLRDAYPHFLADLGAHVVMLDRKEVDPPYVRRKINFLKILALLDPANAGLQQQIGLAWFHLALSYTEMAASRSHLQQALRHLHLALECRPGDPATLNVLGQVDFLLGDYPAAARSWRLLIDLLEPSPAREALIAKLERVSGVPMLQRALVEELEIVGNALELCGHGDYGAARKLLDEIEEQGALPQELPAAEFFFLLGLCREKTGELGGAFAAYQQALEIDPGYGQALEGRDRILDGGAGHDA